ncbi:TPA: ABC transporter ATP-binding protein [Mannheimia haemolytica]|uniref:Leukotoxin translocation ATP-binding protein LktB n=1 Tax=Mannheimia haemolytica TaxID=75985 RepID=A0A378NA40_MANHA|nr:ABC transporter ATP-binding protein [Mannheimia haemolytica]AGQ37608.1 ABC transporter ATP-binding protein [Mannheimia haemolytica D171]EEY11286.1 ABC superfamily ATP binding cassette transporter, ABC protein [Mannheimia haemolytica serotype A2 str. OVINE]EEY11756.1 ABC superfamily ATP binding cassette transporter, ABC protein [Mannheimia haemolytica serotype A2 str. BOVINE]KYL07325.1 ABC transporter ATP-binding protein [Mannheimia haemolytica]KYL15413.1 ABC transporter ATP-binding protein 
MIELNNLFITFNKGTAIENPVLRGLSLKVEQGEFVSVIGSNGAGKSTLLNAISGDCAVDSGEILIQGNKVNQSTTWQRANQVARVFQDPMAGTCESLTIEENMALAYQRGRKRGLGFAIKRQMRELFKDKLALLGLGLENRLTDQMGRLSGGQRQAVSLLMASLQPSNVLLLDEHTAALDPKTTDFVLELTNKIVREQKLTTLMVTHSMRQALDYGDRTVMLHQGQVAFDVSGEQRQKMDVPDLLQLFQQSRHEQLSDDGLLLGN